LAGTVLLQRVDLFDGYSGGLFFIFGMGMFFGGLAWVWLSPNQPVAPKTQESDKQQPPPDSPN
jgi:hypothetical protein